MVRNHGAVAGLGGRNRTLRKVERKVHWSKEDDSSCNSSNALLNLNLEEFSAL